MRRPTTLYRTLSAACCPINRLMVIGWSVCFPVGIIFARFSNSFAEFGFFVHRALQSVGAVLALAGFIVAVSFTKDAGSG